MKIWDRSTGEYCFENSPKKLNFLYNRKLGRFFLRFFISHRCAKMNAKYSKSRFSRRRMKKFIKKYGINLDNFEDKTYKSFNDVFTRKLKTDLLNNQDNNYNQDNKISYVDYVLIYNYLHPIESGE